MRLSGAQAFVTGSSGFIGSRLIRRLTEMSVRVRALVRQNLIAHRASNPGCEFIRGDVNDPDSLQAGMSQCDVVFHCAWGGNTLRDARRINVEGTTNVIDAAARARVKRVVHVSSVAVHGRRLPDVLTEDCPLSFHGDAYAVSKAEGEVAAFERGRALGVEVVALRPTLVYGPGSPIWLLAYFERVKRGQLALVDDGAALVNLVYVDDVVDALCAAAERDAVAGEAFLVSAAEPITWRAYIGGFAAMCRRPLPPSLPRWRAPLAARWLRVYAAATRRPRRLQTWELPLMSQRSTVSIEKARVVLGYVGRTSFDEGIACCERWLRREGYLSPMSTPPSAHTEPMPEVARAAP